MPQLTYDTLTGAQYDTLSGNQYDFLIGGPSGAISGPVSIAVDALCSLIGSIPFFQAWVGAASSDVAAGSVWAGEVGVPIFSVVIASGVLTIATREPHGIASGAAFTIEGASLGAESGIEITGVQTATAVTSTTLSVSTALADAPVAYPDQAFLMAGTRPIVVVCESQNAMRSESIGTGGTSIFSGELEILLEADVSAELANDPRGALNEARSAHGQFLSGLMLTQGTGDLMCLNKAETASAPEFTAKPEQDDNAARYERWRSMIRVGWGLES